MTVMTLALGTQQAGVCTAQNADHAPAALSGVKVNPANCRPSTFVSGPSVSCLPSYELSLLVNIRLELHRASSVIPSNGVTTLLQLCTTFTSRSPLLLF